MMLSDFFDSYFPLIRFNLLFYCRISNNLQYNLTNFMLLSNSKKQLMRVGNKWHNTRRIISYTLRNTPSLLCNIIIIIKLFHPKIDLLFTRGLLKVAQSTTRDLVQNIKYNFHLFPERVTSVLSVNHKPKPGEIHQHHSTNKDPDFLL
jgi:hypothetical protein